MTHLRILCEGEATEPQYLRALTAHLGLTAHVEISCATSPDPQRLLTAAYAKGAGETWLVLDAESHSRDAVRARRLSKVVAQALEKTYPRLALSNPCFEYWLLLHEMPDPRALATPARIVARLEKLWGRPYRKGALPLERLIENGRWKDALERARALRQNAGPLTTAGQWLRQRPFTTVDALVERLVLLSGSVCAAGAPSGEPR
ncbi:MAG: RloB family protein [Verrucomicrobiota bacterium JB022]|nr:RloB family protein [Verrucomicrobiota bacterium JB022]